MSFKYKANRKDAWFTKEDVENLRDELQVGDVVPVAVEDEDHIGGRNAIRTKIRNERIVAKFPNLVQTTGRGTRIVTITYKDILLNALKRAKKHDKHME